MNMETLIFSTIWQHLLISGALAFSLLCLFKFIKVNAEVRSWVWLSSIMALVLVPVVFVGYSLVSYESDKTVEKIENENKLLTTQETLQGDSQRTQNNNYSQLIKDAVQANKQTSNTLTVNKNNIDESINAQLNTSLENPDLYLIQPNRTPSWFVFMTQSILIILPYLIALIGFISVIKLIWLSVQCVNESRIKARATEHVENNIFYSDDIYVPSLVGLFNNKILLPMSVKALSSDNRQFIIAHEQAHLSRKDQIWSFIVRLIDCVIWFSPLFYVMNNELKHVREIACDHRAIDKIKEMKIKAQDSTKNKPTTLTSIEIDYATMLVDSVNLFLMEKQKGEYMNLLNRKGFFRSRVNEVVNKKEDSQVKNMWLSIVSCIALLVSTSVFASNAINNGNIIQNIDEIVDDVNIKNKIKLIDDFFYGLESDVLKIEEFYYDKGLNEYTVNLQFIEENPPEYDNKMHKLLSEFAKSNDLKITKSITFYSIDTVSIFDNDLVSNSPGNINIGNYNYGFNLGDEKETKIVKSLNDFEVDSVSSLTKLGSISKYNRSNNGLFAIFTMQYKIDKNCKYRFEFLWENSGIKTDRNIVTYELSRFQDIQEFCRENKAVKEKQFLVFDRFDYSDSAEMIQLNEIIKMGYLTNRASHEEFNELHGDFIHSFNVEYDDYEPVITKQQRYVYSLLNKISGFVQNEVTSSMSQSYDGLYSIDGFATNLESFNAYINQIKTLAYYDFKYDYFVDENSEIRFMLILDGFAMEDALDQLSDEEIQALLNMQINTTRVFEQPSRPSPEVEAQFEAISLLPQLTLSNIEDELYNRLIDIEGIHITQITDDENFIKIQIIFETIFLHNLFIGMFYDSYPGKIIEPQPQYFQSGEIYNELILPK